MPPQIDTAMAMSMLASSIRRCRRMLSSTTLRLCAAQVITRMIMSAAQA